MQKVPRLARDSTRAWVAFGVSMPLGFALTFGLAVLLLLARDGNTVFELQVLATLLLLTGYYLLYEVLTLRTFRRLSAADLRTALAATEVRGGGARLSHVLSGGGPTAWSSTVAALALIAVVVVAFNPDLRSDPVMLVAAGIAITTSWAILPVAYAVDYARGQTRQAGLEFPGGGEPAFADYLYLSVQVATTYSTSDVTVTTSAMRSRVTRQCLIAFVFNSAIIALLVSALLLATPGPA